ncbi:MAG: hypothetical protein AAGE52_37385, partial [Myxococcota bacterium]
MAEWTVRECLTAIRFPPVLRVEEREYRGELHEPRFQIGESGRLSLQGEWVGEAPPESRWLVRQEERVCLQAT